MPENPTSLQTASNTHKPFVIEIRQDRPKLGGSFVPAASLKFQKEFRTGGLLHFLSPEDLKSLLFLLTFITPEGRCTVSLPILTSAMQVSSLKARARMHRLAEVTWQGEPLISEVPHESGLVTYGLHPRLVAYEHLAVSEQHSTPPSNVAHGLPVHRDRIISHSRRQYTRPREEVERMIAQQMGHDMDETEEHRKLRIRLENAGLTSEQARETIQAFDADTIAQQLDWLPFRHAKNPAGYLLAAIEGGYSEPRGVRAERIARELSYEVGQAQEHQTEEHQGGQDSIVADTFEELEEGFEEPDVAALPVTRNDIPPDNSNSSLHSIPPLTADDDTSELMSQS